MFSRRPSAGADFILLFTSGNLFDNERPVGCGSVVDARWVTGRKRSGERFVTRATLCGSGTNV